MKPKTIRLTISLVVGTPMYDYYYGMNERQRSVVHYEALMNHFLLKTGQLQPQPVYPQPMAYPGWPAVAPALAVSAAAVTAPPAAPQPAIPTPAQEVPAAAPAPVVEQMVAPIAPMIEEPKLSDATTDQAAGEAVPVKKNLIAGFRR